MKKYRKQFTTILKNSRSGTSKSRFIRLFLISLIMILAFGTISAFSCMEYMISPKEPYNFKKHHEKERWNLTVRVPEPLILAVLRWWAVAGCYVIFFIFGIGADAMAVYKQVLKKVGLDTHLPSWLNGARVKARTSTAGGTFSGSNWTIKSYFKNGQKQTSSTMSSK